MTDTDMQNFAFAHESSFIDFTTGNRIKHSLKLIRLTACFKQQVAIYNRQSSSYKMICDIKVVLFG